MAEKTETTKPTGTAQSTKVRCVANTKFYDTKGRLIAKGQPYMWDTADGEMPAVLTEVPEAPKASKAE